MKYLVTGGAGFIGSNVVDRLLADGHDVTVFDNFSTGRRRFLESASKNGRFRLVEGDIVKTPDVLETALVGRDFVFHFAANADVRFGTDHPRRDLDQNTIGTFNVLESMRKAGVRRIAFSSTGAIYGEAKIFPTPEDHPFPVQTSLYGASKLAGEGMIQAYCEGFGFQGYIFRFVSLTGERYQHGHVYDFYRKLRKDPAKLFVLGNGTQRKSYLYVGDCIDAMLLALDRAKDKINILNLGLDEYCTVRDSIGWICERLGISPHIEFEGGERGWVGDNPLIFLDSSRMKALGWKPKVSLRGGIEKTLEYLMENPWVL